MSDAPAFDVSGAHRRKVDADLQRAVRDLEQLRLAAASQIVAAYATQTKLTTEEMLALLQEVAKALE
jgi:hypothetical protein